MIFGIIGVLSRILFAYSVVYYLNASFSGLITLTGEEKVVFSAIQFA